MTGTLSGSVTLPGGTDDQDEHISIRTVLEVDPTRTVPVEMVSFNIADGGQYSVSLPVGSCQVVASSEGKNRQVFDVEILEDAVCTLDMILN